MRGFGDGKKLWRAEIVLRVPGGITIELEQRHLLDSVATRAHQLDARDVGWPPEDLSSATSYDIPPPEPDASIGVACWVMADSVGGAADVAWAVVESAVDDLACDASLWDLRVIPRDAILTAPAPGAPLHRQ